MTTTIRALVLLVALTVSACVYQQHGNRFDPAVISQLTPGVSTEQDATALLGPPASVSAEPGGAELLQWMYVYGTALGTGGGAHVAILFGADGKMVRVTHLSKQ